MKIIVNEVPGALDDAFVALPRLVHAEDPLWIPEEEGQLRAAFSATNPWFARGAAITMSVPGRARLAAFRAPSCRVDGRDAAFFGCFESRGDDAPARALLAHAAEWARTHGAEALYGPVDFDTLGRYRLRTAAEPGGLPFLGEPYNPERYSGVLGDAGLPVVRRYVSQVSTGHVQADDHQRAAMQALGAAGISLEPLDGERWLALLPELHRVADQVFGDTFAYAPVPYDEFARRYGAGVARLLCPHTSLLARDASGGIAAFLLCYPHYGPLVVQGSTLGRVPASEITYAEHAPMLAAAGERTGVGKTIGVVPAHRNRGLLSALGAAAIARGAGRYDRWIAALIRADNPSRRFGERHARHEREYVLHGRSLTDTPLTAPPA